MGLMASHRSAPSVHTTTKVCLLFSVLLVGMTGMASAQLSSTFYDKSCPKALSIIKSAIVSAVSKEARMGASLLRLHFHDCFVQGCDASVLLDGIDGEKTAFPNNNSLRGFEVIDSIKSNLEKECPGVVSCADILTVAARDSVVALGGATWIWQVLLGRRDSTTSNKTAANIDLPSPFLDLSGLISSFANKGFIAEEMVALSGAHTIGQARCIVFRDRIYNETNINPSFATARQSNCPRIGGDDNLAPLDAISTTSFDNAYYTNLVSQKGLFHSDQQLFNGGSTDSQVIAYKLNPISFQQDFMKAMKKMGNLGLLTGTSGQIRTNCRKVN
ncbi:cationic peroxidase 1-like [Alnus glutinosa]|uniref:cationic peroxidase 1-like n=1 Tax=Alnus glutinosa TaxID=3517 RepID=UPI002D77DD56|nr:cationic peroxidase 1-like [Alnus glutinosa]